MRVLQYLAAQCGLLLGLVEQCLQLVQYDWWLKLPVLQVVVEGYDQLLAVEEPGLLC